jgi:hypothetical protein
VNCDDVFEILTRGPFPAGCSTDEAVEQHLAACAECARLARALEPALELVHEALDPEEAADLPEYWGRLAREPGTQLKLDREPVAAAAPALQPRPEEIAQPAPVDTPAHRSSILAALAVAALLMLVVGVTIGRLTRPDVRLQAAPVPVTISSLPAEPLTVESLGLAAACLEQPTSREDSAAVGLPLSATALEERATGVDRRLTLPNGHALACCTSCHNAERPRIHQAVHVSKLTQTCMLCHVGLN